MIKITIASTALAAALAGCSPAQEVAGCTLATAGGVAGTILSAGSLSTAAAAGISAACSSLVANPTSPTALANVNAVVKRYHIKVK